MRVLGLCLALGLSLVILGCETTDDDNLGAVRACDNSAGKMAFTQPAAASAAATACAGIMTPTNAATPEGGTIMFGLILMEDQKFSCVGQMSTALEQPSTGGHDGTLSAMPFLVMNTAADAPLLVSAANTSGSTSLILLANLIQAATYLNGLGGIGVMGTDAFTMLSNCAAGAGGCAI